MHQVRTSRSIGSILARDSPTFWCTIDAWSVRFYAQMIDQTWQANALNVSATASGTPIPATTLYSAQQSTDGKTLVLRYVNFASPSTPTPATKVTVHLQAKDGSVVKTTGTATVWTLQSLDGLGANPPGNPTAISPKKSTLAKFEDGTVLHIPSNAYIIVEATLA